MQDSMERLPRIICYHQTHFHRGLHISLLPLLTEKTAVTHVIVAAIHLNDAPGDITVNSTPYDSPDLHQLWNEVRLLQQAGIKVLGMLGGAAKGTFTRLDQDDDDIKFNAFYQPLRQMVLKTGLDGLDLDVEEEMSLGGIIRLVDQLKADFGEGFILTMAPVATAMERGGKNISGFSYFDFEDAFGSNIAWYNTQFYCGWGNAQNTLQYDRIISNGWNPDKIVLGLSTNQEGAAGWLPDDIIRETLLALQQRYSHFGGVMGWEYFNSVTSLEPFGWPWSWAGLMTRTLVPPKKT